MTAARFALTSAAALALFAFPTDLVSCGPFIPYATFVATKGPIDPAHDFRRHYIGIPGRDWSTKALIVAYRYFNGLDLNEAELKSLYPERRKGAAADSVQEAKTSLKEWIESRKAVPDVAPVTYINTTRSIQKSDSYTSFENCLDDSFRIATATLKARAAKWGIASKEIQDWLNAQDIVFSNCSGPPAQPAPAPPNAPALLKSRPRISDRCCSVLCGRLFRCSRAVPCHRQAVPCC